jgi:hypothetical protein
MFITKRHLSRRTFLRGAGVSVALPFLESMVPAQTPLRNTAASPKTRLGCFYVPHGATMYKWTPATEGRDFQFSETLLPLEKFRNQLTVVTNLAHKSATGADAGAEHARSAALYLSGASPQKGGVRVGTTVDQIVATKIGQDTPLPSLELAIEDVSLSCGAGYGCAYFNTISWRTPTVPLPMENSPQVVFEKLFGDGGTTEQRLSRKREDRSILDSIRQQTLSLQKGLPASDRARVDGYLDDIREIERRIRMSEAQAASGAAVPDAPVGIPETFDLHLKLMFDLLTLAFKSETTRVSTLMYAKDLSPASYPDSGNRSGFHGASHHANVRSNMDSFALINRYHVQMLTYFLDKLAATPDGDGTLLDHAMILYGSSMSNGNQHDHEPLPILLAGGASGRLQGNRHIVAKPQTPMSNLLLGMLDKLGIHQHRTTNTLNLSQRERVRHRETAISSKCCNTGPGSFLMFAGRLRRPNPPAAHQINRLAAACGLRRVWFDLCSQATTQFLPRTAITNEARTQGVASRGMEPLQKRVLPEAGRGLPWNESASSGPRRRGFGVGPPGNIRYPMSNIGNPIKDPQS